MALTIRLEIASVEMQIFSGLAEYVVVPTQLGEVGIYPRHTPLMACLRPGLIRIHKPDTGDEEFFVNSGYLEVQPHVVTVLADTVLRTEQLDAEAARKAMERAERQLAGERGQRDYERIRADMEVYTAVMRSVEQLRKRHGDGRRK